jgi:hypothetical protein
VIESLHDWKLVIYGAEGVPENTSSASDDETKTPFPLFSRYCLLISTIAKARWAGFIWNWGLPRSRMLTAFRTLRSRVTIAGEED